MLGSEYHVFLTNNGKSKNDAKIKRNTIVQDFHSLPERQVTAQRVK